MKRLLVVAAAALVLAVIVVTPALAAGPNGGVGVCDGTGRGLNGMSRNGMQNGNGSGTMFHAVGTVTAVDGSAGTITLNVAAGNRLIQSLVGQTITVTLGEDGFVRNSADPKGTFLTLADVTAGATVSVGGRYDAAAKTYTASRLVLTTPAHVSN